MIARLFGKIWLELNFPREKLMDVSLLQDISCQVHELYQSLIIVDLVQHNYCEVECSAVHKLEV